MSSENTMPASAQAAAVRQMLLDDKSKNSRVNKLETIKAEHPYLTEGVDIVAQETEKPRKAGSGSAPHAPLDLASCL
jgi:hypothetical protein